MIKQKTLIKLQLCAVISAQLAAGCILKKSVTQPPGSPNSLPVRQNEQLPTEPPGLAISGLTPLTNRTPLGLRIAEKSLHDVFVSLAICDCLPSLQAKLTASLIEVRGSLPQALTPAIRREILNNPKLNLLKIIPRPIDEFVGGIFADEQSVATEISNSLKEKIKPAEPNWADSAQTSNLHLDAFVPLPGTTQPISGRSVRMVDVWSRWALVLSQGGPWNQDKSKRNDEGILWLELLRILAEGEYLFGLASTNEGASWGGLTLPTDLQIKIPGSFDPRNSTNQVRFLTGQLDLQLPSNNSLTLARFGGERWSWRESEVSLAEQALQWWTAAQLLSRLRPRNQMILGGNLFAVVPADAYKLSLVALPAMSELLQNRFIDQNTRLIRAQFAGPHSNGISQMTRDKADIQTVSLLLLTLQRWSVELSDLDDLKDSPSTLSQLQSAPPALQRAAQLIIQSILGEHVARRNASESDTTEAPFGIFPDPNDHSRGEFTLRDLAQVIHALTISEKSFMPSPYLQKRILQLAAGLAQRWQEFSTSANTQNYSLLQDIWLKSAGESIVASYPSASVTQLLRPLLAETNKRLKSFDESIAP